MADKNAAPEQTSQASGQAPINVTIVQQDRGAEAAKAMLEAKDLQMDETVVGGRYIVNGKEVNANGDPVGSPLDKSR